VTATPEISFKVKLSKNEEGSFTWLWVDQKKKQSREGGNETHTQLKILVVHHRKEDTATKGEGNYNLRSSLSTGKTGESRARTGTGIDER